MYYSGKKDGVIAAGMLDKEIQRMVTVLITNIEMQYYMFMSATLEKL